MPLLNPCTPVFFFPSVFFSTSSLHSKPNVVATRVFVLHWAVFQLPVADRNPKTYPAPYAVLRLQKSHTSVGFSCAGRAIMGPPKAL
jgi:hypothetical protein